MPSGVEVILKISKLNFASFKTLNKKQAKDKVRTLPAEQNSQNAQLSNIYHTPINFQRKWQEHQSWGLRLNKDGTANAKIFTYPDAKNVTLEVNEENYFVLENKNEGIFEAQIPKGQIKEKDKYRFIIEKSDGTTEKVKDPYTFSQIDIIGPSEVYNHNRYFWQDESWFNISNKKRISRLASPKNGLTSLKKAKIYELHIATLTKKGDLESAKNELQRIKDLGFNAIEIMPVENTYSYNWGYDGVDKFAVANYLGGADKLKEFIDTAHQIGLNVIMDMVPNHLGPDGAQLDKTGPYIKGTTPWGGAFNYEGKDSKYVRDFMVNAALNWLHNFHCDGLRLDMTKFMNSDVTMKQIAAEVNYHFPHAFLIAEDAREHIAVRGDDSWYDYWQPHDQRIIQAIPDNESGYGFDDKTHEKAIQKIENFETSLNHLGYTSEWDFSYHHTLNKLPYGEYDLHELERAIAESGIRVKYSASHDEIGNMDGTRVVAKYMVPLLKLNENIYLKDEDKKRAHEYSQLKGMDIEQALGIVKSQKAQQVSMTLARMVQDGRIERYLSFDLNPETFRCIVLDKLGIKRDSQITPESILSSFAKATKTYRAIEAIKYFTPGPVMTFQGEENLDMSKFNFFREFESIKDERYLYTEKGYPHGYEAFLDSKLNSQITSEQGRKRQEEFTSLIKDLNKLKDESPAATAGQIVTKSTVKHFQNPTIALHSKDEQSGDELFLVANFSNLDYTNYTIDFPKGKWVQIINTNDKKYGGSGTCQNSAIVYGYGDLKIKSEIQVPAKSSIIFKKL